MQRQILSIVRIAQVESSMTVHLQCLVETVQLDSTPELNRHHALTAPLEQTMLTIVQRHHVHNVQMERSPWPGRMEDALHAVPGDMTTMYLLQQP
jgi:hypothetical protein